MVSLICMLPEGVFIAIDCGCLLLIVENCFIRKEDLLNSQSDRHYRTILGEGLACDSDGRVHIVDVLLYLGQRAVGRTCVASNLAQNALSSLLIQLTVLFETHSQCDARWKADNYLILGRRLRGRGHKMSSTC